MRCDVRCVKHVVCGGLEFFGPSEKKMFVQKVSQKIKAGKFNPQAPSQVGRKEKFIRREILFIKKITQRPA